MPTVPSTPPQSSPHTARAMAESFGIDAAAYDRARPPYPDDLIAMITERAPGGDMLDVGCGTGIAARQLQAAGCTVLGIDPDPRMAGFAADHGLPVEVATFEDWDPDGRTFDGLTAAQSWHWVDPVAGATKAAQVLRPGGLLAIFGHVYEPPAEIADAFAVALASVAPETPFASRSGRAGPGTALAAYRAGYAKVAEAVGDTGRFSEPESREFTWDHRYSRDDWLRLLPTTGGLTRLKPDQLTVILEAVGRAIDQRGGSFTLSFTTLAVVASRSVADARWRQPTDS